MQTGQALQGSNKVGVLLSQSSVILMIRHDLWGSYESLRYQIYFTTSRASTESAPTIFELFSLGPCIGPSSIVRLRRQGRRLHLGKCNSRAQLCEKMQYDFRLAASLHGTRAALSSGIQIETSQSPSTQKPQNRGVPTLDPYSMAFYW
jgi:hypothetical protein